MTTTTAWRMGRGRTMSARGLRRLIRHWIRHRRPAIGIYVYDGEILARVTATRSQLLVTLMDEEELE